MARILVSACALCGASTAEEALAEVRHASREVVERLAREHPGWRREDGGCPACVQVALLEVLRERGDGAYHHAVQSAWPIDPEAAFGAVPTPLRLHADPRFEGRNVTIALVDAGFYPHADLVGPSNRIVAWADASGEAVSERHYGEADAPRWPGWDAGSPPQWHGLMTSVAAAGDGALSRGLYRGLAPSAKVVLVQVAHPTRGIRNASIARALRWVRARAARLGIGIVSLSVAGDPVEAPDNEVDRAVADLVADGIVVVAAAGNSGERRLVPPATSPSAITVGGLDDRNVVSHHDWELWRSNYGTAAGRVMKPEVVAPSLWVVAPVLPETPLAREAGELFARRAAFEVDDPRRRDAELRIAEARLVTPHYQHVEGTSFAAPIVAGIAACLREADPSITPARVREILVATAQAVPGAPVERQGAGAVDAGAAVRAAIARSI